MNVGFYLEALEQALLVVKLDVFNSDQRSQFTCLDFMDAWRQPASGLVRAGEDGQLDNVFIECL